MNIQEKYLDNLISEKTFVDIYVDKYETSNFGFIIEYNKDFIILEKINDESVPDGVGVFYRENISRIRWSGNEINSAEKLIDNSKRLKKKIKIDLSSIQSIIKDLNNIFDYVTIYIQDVDNESCFIGEIADIDDKTLVMNEYGTKISLDRKMIMISTKDITLIESGGEYEEKIKRLMI